MLINRRNFLKFFLKSFFLLFTFSVFFSLFTRRAKSISVPDIILANREKITPSIKPETIPDFFAHTNNLRRKSGSPFLAKGYFLSIDGYVTDLLDVPMENVSIKMWHTNHFGYYQHLVDFEDTDKFDQDFVGAGKTTTDNLGYFSFITIEPGYYDNRAPHINFQLEHEHYNEGKPLYTQMFFPQNPMNDKDPVYSHLLKSKKGLVTCSLLPAFDEEQSSAKYVLFNFKLDVIHPLKRY